MLYADEIRDAGEVPELEGVTEADLNEREVAMASQLIESLHAEFDPEAFHDTHREKVLDLIERKAAGEEGLVEAPAPVEADKVVDLMAALEASVAEAKAARKRHPAAAADADGDGSDAAEADAAGADRKPARRTRARKSA